jgi:ribosome assembly protein 1
VEFFKMMEVDKLPSAVFSSSKQPNKIHQPAPSIPNNDKISNFEENDTSGFKNSEDLSLDEEEVQNENKQYFVGFARIYSGTIRVGLKLHILGPQYNAVRPNQFRHEFIVENLYLIMGRGLEAVEEVPAGNIFGIGGVSKYILNSATIASSPYAPIFSAMYFQAAPIMRISLEPQNLSDMKKLVKGLKLLNQ